MLRSREDNVVPGPRPGALHETRDGHASLARPRRVLGARPPRAATTLQTHLVELVALGHSDKQIAAEMGMSYRTVRTHLERLFTRLGVRSRTALAVSWRDSRTSATDLQPDGKAGRGSRAR